MVKVVAAGERSPQGRAGIAFKNLHVYGFGTGLTTRRILEIYGLKRLVPFSGYLSWQSSPRLTFYTIKKDHWTVEG